MSWIKNRIEGRRSADVLQPWRETRKLFSKQVLYPQTAGGFFRFAPLALFASTLSASAMIPLVSIELPFSSTFDLFWVVGFFLLGSVFLALGALDSGTVFGGMGASREMMIVALLEPSILMSVYALSIRAHSSNIFAIVRATILHPGQIASPASALSFAALVIVVIAESGRLPVDNPNTHLELTMIHEAMTLEYSGYPLALIKWASAIRLVLLLGLISNLFLPEGLFDSTNLVLLGVSVLITGAKVTLLASILALAEVHMAKLRLFRVPELLGGSFVLGLLSVTASLYLPPILK